MHVRTHPPASIHTLPQNTPRPITQPPMSAVETSAKTIKPPEHVNSTHVPVEAHAPDAEPVDSPLLPQAPPLASTPATDPAPAELPTDSTPAAVDAKKAETAMAVMAVAAGRARFASAHGCFFQKLYRLRPNPFLAVAPRDVAFPPYVETVAEQLPHVVMCPLGTAKATRMIASWFSTHCSNSKSFLLS